VNTRTRSADDHCETASLGRNFGYSLLTFFFVVLTFGVLVVLALSTSACTWNHQVRCFSVSRDMLGVISSAAEMWWMLALVVALLAAMLQQVSRVQAWWDALIVVPLSILAVGILPIGAASLAREAILDPPFFFAVALVLLAAYELSLFISKQIGKLPI
jgi:hypothetical protein